MLTETAKIIYLLPFLNTCLTYWFYLMCSREVWSKNFSSALWVTCWLRLFCMRGNKRFIVQVKSGSGLQWRIVSWERFTKGGSRGMCWSEWLSRVRVELNSIKVQEWSCFHTAGVWIQERVFVSMVVFFWQWSSYFTYIS